MTQGGATRTVAEFIATVDDSSVPGRDREAAARSCLDTLGVALAGSAHTLGQLMMDEIEERSGCPEAMLIGTGTAVPAPQAALGNGVLAHALDYDDMAPHGHPSGPLFAALLAVAELADPIPGRDFITAYCIGFEVAASIEASCHYDQAERGFHSTGVFGTMAAAAACCRALRLSPHATEMALGLAAAETGGLIANFGSMTKPLHAGRAAESGVRAVLLARAGFTAAPGILETRQGFYEAFAGPGNFELHKLGECLGNPFKAADSLTIKKFPCCGSNHSAIDGVLKAMRDNGLTYADVDAVDVEQVRDTIPPLRFPRPTDSLSAKFSLPYSVGVALRKGAVDPCDFTDEAVQSPEAAEAMAKVRVNVISRWDPEFALGSSGMNPVTLHLRDGRSVSAGVNRHEMAGSPRQPLREDALAAKFRRNAAFALPAADAEIVLGRWRAIDRPDVAIGDLTADLAEKVRAARAVRFDGL